jgi:hypothetical protein
MMAPDRILGDYGNSNERCEYLTLAFSPLSVPLRTRWRNNGLSADFLGDYVTTFLPAASETASAGKHQAEIRHAVTYIANELLENAMKYHAHEVDIPIRLRLELADDRITVSATNGAVAGQAEHYRTFVERIAPENAGDLLVRQLEDTAAGNGSAESCLGLLTMMNDYGAKLGWRFEQHGAHPGVTMVTTRAILPLKDRCGERA